MKKIYKIIDILNINESYPNNNKIIKKIPKLNINFLENNKKKLNNLINKLIKTEIIINDNKEIIYDKELYYKINNTINVNFCINSIMLIIDNINYLDECLCNNFKYIYITKLDDIIKINNFNINDTLDKYDVIVMTFKCFNDFISLNNMLYKSVIFYKINIYDIIKKIKTYNIVNNYILLNINDVYKYHNKNNFLLNLNKNNNYYYNNCINKFINNRTFHYYNKIKLKKNKILKKKTYIYKIKPNFIKDILEKKNIYIDEKFIANIAYNTKSNFILYLYNYIYENLKLYISLQNILHKSIKIFCNENILIDNDCDIYIFSNLFLKKLNIISSHIINNILRINFNQYNKYYTTINLYINNCIEIILKLKYLLTINVINNKCYICNNKIKTSYTYTCDISCGCFNINNNNSIELSNNIYKKIKPFKFYNLNNITNYINCSKFELLLIIIKKNNNLLIIYNNLNLLEINTINSFVKKNIKILEHKNYNIKKKYNNKVIVFYDCIILNNYRYNFPEIYNDNKKSKYYYIF